jgi:1-acyl-sn-glycerol-3-phosphate acyltransferase
MTPIYRVSRIIVRLFMAVLVRLSVTGADHLPREGPVILVSNHLSNADAVIFGVTLPRQLHYMAKIELYAHPFFGLVVRAFHAFPVRRGEGDRQALRKALELLSEGRVIGLFPEGHRSRTGVLQQANAGAALIAYRSGALVFPAAITGTDQMTNPIAFFLRRGRIRVVFGEPFRLERPGTRVTAADLERGLSEMMGRVAALLPPERRGPWAEAAALTPAAELK